MNHEHLFLKLKLRRYMLKQRALTAWRGQAFGNFRNTRSVSEELFNTVVAECVAEGTITVSKGEKGGELLTWHEDAIVPMEASRG